MKIKLLILMVLALTVTACEESISTAYVEDLEARVTQLETRLNQSTVAPRVTTLEKKINIICDEVKLYSQDNPVFSSWFGYDPARIITGVQHREVPINAKHMMNNHNHEHEIYINKELCR